MQLNKHKKLQHKPNHLLGKLIVGVSMALTCLGVADAMSVGGAEGGAASSANPLAGNPTAARQGEELFGRNCQQCHNSAGKGGKGPQLIKGAWGPGGANSDAFMFKTISEGRPNTQMGGWGGSLKPEEIWQIVTYLREEAKRVKQSEKAEEVDPLSY
ncbi:c-type cytochrome [Ampullimonas aquatilis]|uniref:c-type cytochrome n=1 Tax=Ampullimonas aquatilis TaxID=1341549 RepID=UPI003C77445C